MIIKLRRKFILVIMAVVSILIATAFVAVLTTTSTNLARESSFALKEAIKKLDAPQQGFGPENHRQPTITVVMDETGSVVTVQDRFFNLGDDELKTITSEAIASGTSEGQLHDFRLRYLIDNQPDGQTVIAFVDISMEKSIIGNLLASSALIGGTTLLLFFAVSIILSRWVVRPVEQAWNSQRQFVADASHELKTPLTVVLSNVEMMSGDDTIRDEKTQTRLENILEEARRMRALVDDLLMLAKSDSVGRKKCLDKVELSTLVRTAVLNFEPVFYDAGMRLEEHIEDGLSVRGDKTRICQLVEILLDNAAKYTLPKGLVNVRLTTAGKSDILLEVINESESIPKDELERIFQRFYRLDKARSSGGYGLGLAIADSIAREHNGKIIAKSENKLTAFCVTLPTAR